MSAPEEDAKAPPHGSEPAGTLVEPAESRSRLLMAAGRDANERGDYAAAREAFKASHALSGGLSAWLAAANMALKAGDLQVSAHTLLGASPHAPRTPSLLPPSTRPTRSFTVPPSPCRRPRESTCRSSRRRRQACHATTSGDCRVSSRRRGAGWPTRTRLWRRRAGGLRRLLRRRCRRSSAERRSA